MAKDQLSEPWEVVVGETTVSDAQTLNFKGHLVAAVNQDLLDHFIVNCLLLGDSKPGLNICGLIEAEIADPALVPNPVRVGNCYLGIEADHVCVRTEDSCRQPVKVRNCDTVAHDLPREIVI